MMNRNGFFYVANRDTGKVISAKPFVPINWATGIDLATGRPIEVADKRPRAGHTATDICPNLLGGKNWQPMSFDRQTGLVYIPTNNICMDMAPTEIQYKRGAMYLGKEFPAKPGPGGYLGELFAWKPVKQEKVWGSKETTPFKRGTLAIAGGGAKTIGRRGCQNLRNPAVITSARIPPTTSVIGNKTSPGT